MAKPKILIFQSNLSGAICSCDGHIPICISPGTKGGYAGTKMFGLDSLIKMFDKIYDSDVDEFTLETKISYKILTKL